MNKLSEIENAVASLTAREQKALLSFLSARIHATKGRARRGLRAAARSAIEGLPADLSSGTRERVREMMARRHAPNR